jgi:hypothetical protein
MAKSKIHLDSGRALQMSFSGRHTICLCGKTFQDNYMADARKFTQDWDKVTCKHCLIRRSWSV